MRSDLSDGISECSATKKVVLGWEMRSDLGAVVWYTPVMVGGAWTRLSGVLCLLNLIATFLHSFCAVFPTEKKQRR